jgi:hypothetical protein
MVFEVYPDGLTHLPFTDSLNKYEARIPALLAKLLEQLDYETPLPWDFVQWFRGFLASTIVS